MNQLNEAIAEATIDTSKATLTQLYTMVSSLTKVYAEIMWSTEKHDIDNLITAYEMSQSFASAIERNLELAFPGIDQLAFNKRYSQVQVQAEPVTKDG